MTNDTIESYDEIAHAELRQRLVNQGMETVRRLQGRTGLPPHAGAEKLIGQLLVDLAATGDLAAFERFQHFAQRLEGVEQTPVNVPDLPAELASPSAFDAFLASATPAEYFDLAAQCHETVAAQMHQRVLERTDLNDALRVAITEHLAGTTDVYEIDYLDGAPIPGEIIVVDDKALKVVGFSATPGKLRVTPAPAEEADAEGNSDKLKDGDVVVTWDQDLPKPNAIVEVGDGRFRYLRPGVKPGTVVLRTLT